MHFVCLNSMRLVFDLTQGNYVSTVELVYEFKFKKMFVDILVNVILDLI